MFLRKTTGIKWDTNDGYGKFYPKKHKLEEMILQRGEIAKGQWITIKNCETNTEYAKLEVIFLFLY